MLIRQGDVLLQPRAPLSDAERVTVVPRENGRVVLAHGEVTGHAHALCDPATTLYDLGVAGRVVECGVMDALVHEEHTAAQIQGTYRVIRQRQMQAGMASRVAD